MRVLAIAIGLAAALGGMSGCAPTPEPASSGGQAPGVALGGGEWKVFEIDGKPVVAGSKATITFEEGRVFGAGSCNRFMGGYKLAADGLTLEMSQMASTMMACPDALMDQEGRYLGVLGAVTGYSVDGDVLTLKTAEGKTVKARR